jgi:hypothetical protein
MKNNCDIRMLACSTIIISKTLKELPVFFENGIAMILCQHRKGEIYENDKS